MQRDRNEKARPVYLASEGPFNDLLMNPVTSLVNASGVYPLSNLRDVQRTANTGSITDSTNGEYRVRHATGSDEASLVTAQHGRYAPGHGAEAGIGIRFDGTLSDASSYAEWGYLHEASDGTVDDGLLFGVDTTGTYIRVVRNGTQTFKTYAGSWNMRASAIDATQADGAIYQIRFSYYGYGLVEFYIVNPSTGDGQQEPILVHTWAPTSATSLTNSNLQVGARVGSTAGTDDFSVYVGGRKFHVLGDYKPQRRVTGAYASASSVGTTTVPILSFRRKAAEKWDPVTITPAGFDTIVATNNMVFEVRVGSTLTGASWGSVTNQPDDETSLEMDTTASAVNTATGVLVWAGLLESGAGSNTASNSVAAIPTDVGENAVISYCARAVTSTADIELVARVIEEW